MSKETMAEDSPIKTAARAADEHQGPGATATTTDEEKLGFETDMALLMEMEAARQPGDGPNVIAVPSSRADKWVEKIRSTFHEKAVPILYHTDSALPPTGLSQYKIVVVSYDMILSEYRQLVNFSAKLEQYKNGETDVPPKRPQLCFLSGIWEMAGGRKLGTTLLLDQPHVIEDDQDLAHAAISKLRERLVNCFLTSGTSLDGTWAVHIMELVTTGDARQ